MTVVMKSSASAMAPNPLRQLLIGDLLAAGLSSLAVTPAVAIIDKGVVSAASGIAPSVIASILASIGSMVRSPLKFVQSPEFMWIWAVYFLTYLVANSIATLCESREIKAASPVFLGTTAANLGMCISKDAAFAKIFGTGPPRPLPLLTYLLFVLRDGGTVSASFTLPSKVSARLQQRGWSSTLADNVAQLSCPMLVQILSTNLHLYGLDLYNRPVVSALSDRVGFVKSQYKAAVFARCGRILPAFGLGGIGNRMLRNSWRSSVLAECKAEGKQD